MATIAEERTCRLLRTLAAALDRFADRIERPASTPRLALEPSRAADHADERIHERRHQLFVRYY